MIQKNETTTRGIRNNNPLNIKISKSKWVGKITKNKKDQTFEEFDTMKNGVRAAVKLLQNYIKSSFNTVDAIITRWCPDDTSVPYADFVENLMKKNLIDYKEGDTILWYDFESLFVLTSSMAWVESSYKLDRALFTEAWLELDPANRSNKNKVLANLTTSEELQK